MRILGPISTKLSHNVFHENQYQSEKSAVSRTQTTRPGKMRVTTPHIIALAAVTLVAILGLLLLLGSFPAR